MPLKGDTPTNKVSLRKVWGVARSCLGHMLLPGPGPAPYIVHKAYLSVKLVKISYLFYFR